MFIINANELGHYRLGFVINKKRVALAIDRNRIKRLMREFFRIQCQSIGIDVVMIVKRDTSKYSNEQLREELKILWEAVKRYCKIS